MKKIIIISAMSAIVGLTACDMDKLPYDNIETSKSLETVADCKAYRNDLYADFRNILYDFLGQEIAADGFNPVIGYTNTYGGDYRWETEASGTAGRWSDNYYTIANANLMIERIPGLINGATEAEKKDMQLYLGEAYFSRALAYYELTLRYCKDYEPSSASSDMGVPIVLKYAPSSIASTYPGRSSMEDVYKQIVSDLNEAAKLITVEGKPCYAYITQDGVKAFKARLALQMHDWNTAISAATDLINSKKYTLISDSAKYADMWLNDNGEETIWQIAQSMTEHPATSSPGSYLYVEVGDKDNTCKPDYVPESGIIKAFDQANDIRFASYFTKRTVSSGIGYVDLFIVTKYPGNPTLYDGKSNYHNMQKVYRISEMYLIAAEAYAQNGNSKEASSMLNGLRTARIANWTAKEYSGSTLLSEIQTERWKELFCEGYRMTDLKRWNMDMRRTPAQNSSYIVLPGAANGENMVKEAGNFRFVWPIPQAEIDANPQMKNQQNPGY